MKRELLCFMALLIFTATVAEADWDRNINFAGYSWVVKDVYMGPGPNYFSDSEEEVWVDEDGYLHLEINYRDGVWKASEVVLNASVGYGTYIYVVDGRMDLMNEEIVLGMFNWDSYAPEERYREIDIEYSRWGHADWEEEGQYVLWPANISGNKYRFDIVYDMGTNVTTNLYQWTEDVIYFRTYFGDYTPDPAPENMVASWDYFGKDNPTPGIENARINFWLVGGTPPSDGHDAEVIIKDFKLLPEAGADDFSPPEPNPIGWVVEPYATGPEEITMTAAIATDDNRVLYRFICTEGDGHDSGWQGNPVYTDKGLETGMTYTYVAQTRDCSANMNEGSVSVAKSATTTTGLEIHVHDITMDSRQKGNRYYGQAIMWVKDQFGYDVEGAEVHGEWTGDINRTATPGLTGPDGTVLIETPYPMTRATYIFTVTDIIKGGCIYNPDANVETSDSITVP